MKNCSCFPLMVLNAKALSLNHLPMGGCKTSFSSILVLQGDCETSFIEKSELVNVWLEVETQHYHPTIEQIVYQFFMCSLQGNTVDHAIMILVDHHHLSYSYYFMKTPLALVINSRPIVKAWWEDKSSSPTLKKVAEGMTFSEK
ncbi:hypothetical protein PVL29_003495 [Vitis rotundifolia]|uniref:glutathione transferase n=1 Tax=Vitis rotundifolia TaxID=103349 RepID=A0AA39AFK3_VITRO|nr:hypothetical protein PVL29_003495 [Vitis rotundifolia]